MVDWISFAPIRSDINLFCVLVSDVLEGAIQNTYSTDTIVIERSIIATAPQGRNLTLSSVEPHVIQGWSNAPIFRKKNLLHHFDSDRLNFARSGQSSSRTRNSDIEVQVGDSVRHEPR